MTGCLRGCVGRILTLGLLLAAGLAAWTWGPQLASRVRAEIAEADAPPEASPEIAEATLDRFESFRKGDGEDRLPLGESELSSVMRYALPGILPPGIDHPSVELGDGHVRITARVAIDAFPDLSLGEVAALLPDTVDIDVRGTLTPLDDKRLALHVDHVEASRIPIPGRLVPGILSALGRTDVRGLPTDALAIPLPAGLRTAYVLRDSLVLVADR